MADTQISYHLNNSEEGQKEPRKTRKHRDWSGALFGLLIGCAGLALGRLGQLWLRFDLFSQFSIQAFLLVVACAVALFAPRYKSLVAGVLFVFLIAGYGLWAHFASPGRHQAAGAG